LTPPAAYHYTVSMYLKGKLTSNGSPVYSRYRRPCGGFRRAIHYSLFTIYPPPPAGWSRCFHAADGAGASPDLGKSGSDLGKSDSDLGKSVPDLGKSDSDLGKSNADSGKSDLDLGKRGSRVGKPNSRVGKRGSRVGGYEARAGKYGVYKITIEGDR
jgi:hypothetical protein